MPNVKSMTPLLAESSPLNPEARILLEKLLQARQHRKKTASSWVTADTTLDSLSGHKVEVTTWEEMQAQPNFSFAVLLT